MTHVANPVNRRLGVFPTLTVRGRRSGRPITVPLGEPLRFEGKRYLVSGRGETHWVRNLRAAGEGEMRIHRRSEPFRAIEIVGPQRDRVVAAYRAKLGPTVDRYFEEIPDPGDHPVFMLEDASATTASAVRG
jgi:deazaflavin-dependent oxidoreductase (nitroreductase family)